MLTSRLGNHSLIQGRPGGNEQTKTNDNLPTHSTSPTQPASDLMQAEWGPRMASNRKFVIEFALLGLKRLRLSMLDLDATSSSETKGC